MIQNARIVSTVLFDRERGLSYWINLDFGGGLHGAAGGIMLGDPSHGVGYLAKLCEMLGAESWEKLPGTPIRVMKQAPESRVTAIGHYVDDRWWSL